MDLGLELRALDAGMVAAWQAVFPAGIKIGQGDILAARADAVISPANSFGFMDGGIDLHYVNAFGWELQDRLQAHIANTPDGVLLVGQATVIPTGHAAIPFLVSAPTMRVPSRIGTTVNVYLAFRAALLAVRRHNAGGAAAIRSLLCPALGAGIGGMPPGRVARQMWAAWEEVVLGRDDWRGSARGILSRQAFLLE